MAWKWVSMPSLAHEPVIVAFGGEAQPWLFDPVLSVICIILLVSWQTLGYGILIILSTSGIFPNPFRGGQTGWRERCTILLFHVGAAVKAVPLYVSVVTLISGFNVYAQAFILRRYARAPAAWYACWFLMWWRTASKTSVSDMQRPRR